MLQVQGLHGLGKLSNVGDVLIQQQMMNSFVGTVGEGGGVLSSLNSGLLAKSHERKLQEAANKHALAERNRRKRINAHLNTLRELFPNLPKRDKPRVLMETVKYLKELRRKVTDHHLFMENGEEGCCIVGNGNSSLFLPGKKDEVKVSYYEGDQYQDQGQGKKLLTVKATICCEDKPRLNGQLNEAMTSVKGKVVKAEMATIGGRTKAVLVVQWCKDGGGGGGEAEKEVASLRLALKAVVDNQVLGSLGSECGSLGSTSLGF